MRNGVVFKRAENVNERVHLAQMADVGGLFQRVLADGADVDVFDRGVRQLLRVVERGQLVEALVGTLATPMCASRGFENACSERLTLSECEKRCLADLRQTDDASFHGEFSALSSQPSVQSEG